VLAALALAATTDAQAASHCRPHRDRVVASGPQLVMLRGSRVEGAKTVYIVCRRTSGARRTLVASYVADLHQPITYVPRVAVRGRFAYAVVSRYDGTQRFSEIARMDTGSGRVVRHPLRLGDQGEREDSEVTSLAAAAHGRAVLRVRNAFAAGIVLDGPTGAAYLDEGLADAVGRPRVAGGQVIWRHGSQVRSSPAVLADRCPVPPAPKPRMDATYTGLADPLASADAATSDNWFCVRSSGRSGELDGDVVRLLGPLAVVQRSDDVRVVDLRTQATVNGPAPCPRERCIATVGVSGTLVFRRFGPTTGEGTVLVAVQVGMPAREIARSDRFDAVRYEDGVLRYETYPFEPSTSIVTQELP
jgi:hypothetical protein